MKFCFCTAARLSAAVHEILLPIMKEMKNDLNSIKDDLNSVKNDLSSFNETVSKLSVRVSNLTEISSKMDTLDSKLDSVNISIREDLSCIKEDLSSLNERMNRISDNVEEHDNHTTTELMSLYEYLQPNLYTCGGVGWRRVVYLDMTDPNTNCPSGWQLTSYSKRTCGKVSIGSRLTCDSVNFTVSGGDYTRVCGRIKAYQVSHTDAFEAYDDGTVTTIDGAYVSGISLTHGSPRQHIWTFAAGASEGQPTWVDACPCDANIHIAIPPFVGEDYFCESGINSGTPSSIIYPHDPLWDGQNCTATSRCCSFNRPPYFTKELPSPTTDDIEARMCWLTSNDQSPIELIELYVR